MAATRLRVLGGHLNQNEKTSTKSSTSDGGVSSTYTFNNGTLTPEQRKFYDDKGFLVIRDLVKDEDVKKYVDRFRDICTGKVPKSPGMVLMKDISSIDSEYVKGEKAINKIQDYQYDEVLSTYYKLPEITHYAECFTGPDIMAAHTMLVNKPPDTGSMTSRHPVHQDLHYFSFRPTDRIVCSWTALEKVNRQNGCLVVIPGTHNNGVLLPHVYPDWKGGVNKLYHGIQDFDPNAPRAYLEMEAGDTVFFHPLLIHGSGSNKTRGFRKAISCHFASSHVYFINVENTVQKDLADEIRQSVKDKYGQDTDITFEDVWRMRMRHVKGKELVF